MNIFLVGYMGSGKSYVGKRLAMATQAQFIDLDDYIEANEGESISQIWAKDNGKQFRRLERLYLKRMRQFDRAIIATGGGTPCFFKNMEWMNTNGLTVYLKTPVALLVNRLIMEIDHRPILANKTEEEITAFITGHLAKRESFYGASSVVYDQKVGDESIVKELFQYFKDVLHF